MRKSFSRLLAFILSVIIILSSAVSAFAATNCNKGHKFDANHYCKTCNVFDSTYTGMARNKTTWYYVKKGKIDTSYTGMAKNQYGWFYIKSGKLDSTYTGMAKNQYGWWYMKNGKLDTSYTGMAKNQYGWWYMKNGKLDTSYTGMAKNQYGWWYMKNGKLDTTYTGIANNQYGSWYMSNGKLNSNYTGIYTDKSGNKWNVVKGKATAYVNRSISVNVSSVTLSVGESYTVTVAENSGEDLGMTYEIIDENVAKCRWGDWTGETVPLTITGLSSGSTKVNIYYTEDKTKVMATIDVYVKSVQRTILVSSNNVTVKRGERASIKVTQVNSKNQFDTIVFQEKNTAIVSCEWGDIDGASCPLYFTGNIVGTTKVYIYFKDDPNNIIQTINVTVESGYSLSLPSTPQNISNYSYNGKIMTTVKITDINVSIERGYSIDTFNVKISGVKTYGATNVAERCRIGYKVYDSNNNVVESGTWSSPNVVLGESFVMNHSIHFNYNEDAPGNYRLELVNVR